MPNSDIQPPRAHTPLDDEIRDAAEKVRKYRIWRNIIWGGILIWVTVEIVLILIAVLTHYPDWDYAPWIVGIVAPIILSPFIGIVFSDEDTYSRAKLTAAETQLERLKAKRRELGIGRGRSRNALYQRYKESMPELVERYRLTANHYRSIYNTLQAFIIIGSLLASTFVGAFEPVKWAKWAAVILAASVGISSAIGAHFKLNERSTEMQKTADLIEIEFRAVEFGIGDYEGLDPEESLKAFVEKVEQIRTEHLTKKRQLDQPSDVHFIDSSSIG
jgi:hypothetical protein